MLNLPAGLLDERIEFFRDPYDSDLAYALTGGRVSRVKDLPNATRRLVWENLLKHPRKVEALVATGYTRQYEMLEKYCSCNFGLYDGKADYDNGNFNHEEYVPCERRDTCPVNGVLCNPLTVGDGQALTHRQTAILRLIGRCLLNKEIADELSISPETVKIHVKHIQQKSGLMNKKDLVLLAHQKQLA